MVPSYREPLMVRLKVGEPASRETRSYRAFRSWGYAGRDADKVFDCDCVDVAVDPAQHQHMNHCYGTGNYIPTRRLKAAGFRSSKELSSFSGVLHFWQYILKAPFHVHRMAQVQVSIKL